MDSLGFRPPQFSEDLAWLPPWLQHPQTQASSENVKDTQIDSDRASKGNVINGTDAELLQVEGSGYYSCHLFWSGEDSHNTVGPLQNNMLQLCLRLSSDGLSHYSQSQLVYASQTLPVSTKILSIEQAGTAADPGEKSFQSKMDHSGVRMKVSHQNSEPTAVGDVGPLSYINSRNRKKQQYEQFTDEHIEDADIKDVVELSIAASEALAIHGLVETGSDSDVLPGAILEAALRVKQVRLETTEDAFCCPSEQINEIDSLSDLDDSLMEDALLDVGLSLSDPDDEHHCSLNISYVKDTPTSENQSGHENESELAQYVTEKDKFNNYSSMSLNTLNVVVSSTQRFHQPGQGISHVSSVIQPEACMNSSHACVAEKSDRFKSRWFGGWAVKEVNASAKMELNKPTAKYFVGETSSLSESADIAPDENSFVQTCQTGPKIASQCRIPSEVANDKPVEGILNSQDVRSSNLSSVDPLCSAVPCSISLENHGSPSVQNGNGRENSGICFIEKSETKGENQKTLDLNDVSLYVDGKYFPTATSKHSQGPISRRLPSLRNYSTFPNCDANLGQERLDHNQQWSSRFADKLLPPYQGMDSKGSSDRRKSRAVIEHNTGEDNQGNQNTEILQNAVAERTSQNIKQNELANVEMQAFTSAKQRSSDHLNRRLPALSLFVNDLTGEENPQKFVGQDNTIKLCKTKIIQKQHSKLEYPHNIQYPYRKRVCLSKSEVEFQQQSNPQKLQYMHRNCFAARVHDVRSFIDHKKFVKQLLFHGSQFLLTGFSSQKEKEITGLVQRHGGVVLLDIPSPNSKTSRSSRYNIKQLPIILCSKKLRTTKFLYGCAVNALILKLKWLTDSIARGLLLDPEKYMILMNQLDSKHTGFGMSVHLDDCKYIFDKVGIILQGKNKFCSKLEMIIRHGGGQVFKNLQRLIQSIDANRISMGVIVAENERVLRHLKLCAMERKIPMMPASWITKSLHFGELLPFKELDAPLPIKGLKSAASMDWSEEI